ncbi:hypothetical protein ACLOJK_041076 [Asimina triloba]
MERAYSRASEKSYGMRMDERLRAYVALHVYYDCDIPAEYHVACCPKGQNPYFSTEKFRTLLQGRYTTNGMLNSPCSRIVCHVNGWDTSTLTMAEKCIELEFETNHEEKRGSRVSLSFSRLASPRLAALNDRSSSAGYWNCTALVLSASPLQFSSEPYLESVSRLTLEGRRRPCIEIRRSENVGDVTKSPFLRRLLLLQRRNSGPCCRNPLELTDCRTGSCVAEADRNPQNLRSKAFEGSDGLKALEFRAAMSVELPELENSSPVAASNATSVSGGDASVSSSGQIAATPAAAAAAPATNTTKKKRNLPGMPDRRNESCGTIPDPDAEVIALSPKTLMATNRFVCEICNKGFQRDQNLQLHRRGHNLPWKLRQRSGKEVRKRVYVCPESSCVHHDPSRALGDLTGIKKHFCRKHGEKKWKCDKCSKKYAVQSDWKAHSKTCGTREYRCDCGTLFSRRDSFITHRAFCDALAEESAKAQTAVAAAPAAANSNSEEDAKLKISPSATTTAAAAAAAAAATDGVASLPIQQRAAGITEPENPTGILNQSPAPPLTGAIGSSCISSSSSSSSATTSTTNASNSSSIFASIFASASAGSNNSSLQSSSSFTDLIGSMTRSDRSTTAAPVAVPEPTSLCLASSTLFSPLAAAQQEHPRRQFATPPPPHMSATALLQKAAQMGAAATNSSLFRGFGLGLSSMAPSTTAPPQQDHLQWHHQPEPAASGLGLGLPYNNVGLPELVMGQSLFVSKPATLDLLGLGMGMGGNAAGGGPLSALITSIGGGLDVAGSFAGGNSPAASGSKGRILRRQAQLRRHRSFWTLERAVQCNAFSRNLRKTQKAEGLSSNRRLGSSILFSDSYCFSSSIWLDLDWLLDLDAPSVFLGASQTDDSSFTPPTSLTTIHLNACSISSPGMVVDCQNLSPCLKGNVSGRMGRFNPTSGRAVSDCERELCWCVCDSGVLFESSGMQMLASCHAVCLLSCNVVQVLWGLYPLKSPFKVEFLNADPTPGEVIRSGPHYSRSSAGRAIRAGLLGGGTRGTEVTELACAR